MFHLILAKALGGRQEDSHFIGEETELQGFRQDSTIVCAQPRPGGQAASQGSCPAHWAKGFLSLTHLGLKDPRTRCHCSGEGRRPG